MKNYMTPILRCPVCFEPILVPYFGIIDAYCTERCANSTREITELQLGLSLLFPTMVEASENPAMD